MTEQAPESNGGPVRHHGCGLPEDRGLVAEEADEGGSGCRCACDGDHSQATTEGVVLHSDRGSQYCSRKVRRRLEHHGFVQSMSRRGDCWDDEPAESFLKTLKNELCGHRAFARPEIARMATFECIEVFYNCQRLHSSLGYLTPVWFEQTAATKAA